MDRWTRWAILFIFTFLIFGVLSAEGTQSQLLQQAEASYQRGEQAVTVAERREAFNGALELYLSLEKKWAHPDLYYNIGNSYFQLEEYPWAILYYRRALLQMPRNETIRENLRIAQGKQKLTLDVKQPFLQKVFFFHYGLSIKERLQIFFVFSVLSFVLASFYIWLEKRIFKIAASWLAVGVTGVLLSLTWSNYFSSIQAVVVQSTALLRDAGTQYAPVMDFPVSAGDTVEVLEVVQEGQWLKIRTNNGDFGYVSHKTIRLIE